MYRRNHITRFFITGMMLVLLITGTLGKKAYADSKVSISDIMQLTGIMADTDGNFIPKNKYVTREEFSQLLIQASTYAKDVKSINVLKLFKDVPKNDSKAPYIQLAVMKGYMSGYLDGTFKPDRAVTLKDAVYGMLQILGYTKADFSGNLSVARFDKSKELGLGKKLSLSETDKITKKDCEILFYNLLNAKQKSGDIYGKALGYSYKEDGTIDYDAMLTGTKKGPYITNQGWEKKLVHKLSDYTIMNENEEISASDIQAGSIVYYSEKAKKIWIYTDKVYGIIDNITFNQGEPQDLSIDGTLYTIEKPKDMKEQLQAADISKGMPAVLLLGQDDKVSRVYPMKSLIAGASLQQQVPFSLTKAAIYKNDKNASVQDMNRSDVIYYSTDLKTVWAFDKKIYGTLDNITSVQGEPQELTIAGTAYPVENSKTIKQSIKDSSIKAGMPVVLLFGWNDKVTQIMPINGLVAEDNWEDKLSFAPNMGTVYKNGVSVSASIIKDMDVIYYSNELKTIWVYDSKVYGNLQSVSTDISAPTSISVAGKSYDLKLIPANTSNNTVSGTYDLSENAWGERLRENGINSGDSIVLLFGYNGNVADIRKVEKMPVTITGYVLSIDEKLVKNENKESTVKKVIKIVDTQGIVREFPCNEIISVGSVVEVNFKDGKPVITTITNLNIPSGLTLKTVAADAGIIGVNGSDYSKIKALNLKETGWDSSNVIYFRLNSAGEITDLILRNITECFYQYGILKKVALPEYGGDLQLVFDMNGKETTMDMLSPTWDLNLGPKALLIEDNNLKDMKTLKGVRISYISGSQANTGDAVYWIADDVTVYFYKSGTYYKGSMDDITNFANYKVNGYMVQQQGPIHIIVISD